MPRIESPTALADGQAGLVSFLGQRYHACVPLTFVGLGVVVGSGIRGATDDGKVWASVLGLLAFFGGLAWWIALRRRLS